MTIEQEADEARPRGCFGCLPWLIGGIVGLIVVATVLAFIFDQDEAADQPDHSVNAGPAEQYAFADVTYIEPEHLFVVRLQNGDFLALYDRSSKQQTLGSNCRVGFDETAVLQGLPQLEGFDGAFVEECEGQRAVWRADGEFVSGANFGNLDEFRTSIDEAGDLIVDTETRTCTRAVGVGGIPPFRRDRCDGNP
jgi:hypothetical protein